MGSSPSQPTVPTQAENLAGQSQAATLQQQFGQYGGSNAFGNISFTGTPGEDRVMNVDSPLMDSLAGQFSTSYGNEAAERAEGAVYDTFSNKYDPLYARQDETLKNQLIQQGIPVGSEAYDRATSDLYGNQEDARLNAMNQSVLTGQNTQNSQIANLLAMSQGANPMNMYQPGIGGSSQFSNPVTDNYTMQSNNYQSELDAYNSKWSTLGGLGGSVLGGALAGPIGGALGSSISGLFSGGTESDIPKYLSPNTQSNSDWISSQPWGG